MVKYFSASAAVLVLAAGLASTIDRPTSNLTPTTQPLIKATSNTEILPCWSKDDEFAKFSGNAKKPADYFFMRPSSWNSLIECEQWAVVESWRGTFLHFGHAVDTKDVIWCMNQRNYLDFRYHSRGPGRAGVRIPSRQPEVMADALGWCFNNG